MLKRTEARLNQAKTYIDRGVTIQAACKKAGISQVTWYKHSKKTTPMETTILDVGNLPDDRLVIASVILNSAHLPENKKLGIIQQLFN